MMFDFEKKKKCKWCGSEMPYSFAVCPECNQSQNETLEIIGIVLAVLIIFSVFVGTRN